MLWGISWAGKSRSFRSGWVLVLGVAPGRGQSKYVLGSLECGSVMLEGREKEA